MHAYIHTQTYLRKTKSLSHQAIFLTVILASVLSMYSSEGVVSWCFDLFKFFPDFRMFGFALAEEVRVLFAPSPRQRSKNIDFIDDGIENPVQPRRTALGPTLVVEWTLAVLLMLSCIESVHAVYAYCLCI